MKIEVKDQIRSRMGELEVTAAELGRRIGVTAQTVRCWINGRNFPNKKLTSKIDNALTFKLDYSEGATEHTNTVSDSIQKSHTDALVAINKLPPSVQLLFHELAKAYAQSLSAAQLESKMLVSQQYNRSATKASQRPLGNKRWVGDETQIGALRVTAPAITGWSD